MTRALLIAVVLLAGCPQRMYHGVFLNITNYKVKKSSWVKSPKEIRIKAPRDYAHLNYYTLVDEKVDALEACLLKKGLIKEKIRRDWIAVLVPPDWYESTCTPEQLIPSRINYTLCEKKKDSQGNPIKIPVVCRNVVAPTKECPCPCNARAAIQDNYIVVTAPNLKLLKAEVARLVLWPKYNMPWVKPVSECLR